ncbi:MAG: MFS transporter [Candidatus Dormibacteraeota bacterium]|nr:MFS transporter [Candidatus Dormibacteraeota bacterium]
MIRRLRHLAVDVSPLRDSRQFRLLFIGQLISLIGRQITVVAVPYQVYLLTHSSFRVGLLGAVQLVPFIVFSIVAGPIADQVDRRKLLLATQALLATTSLLFVVGAIWGQPPLLYLYGVAAAAAGVSAVDQPARTATVPNLVSRAQMASAVSLNYLLFQLGTIAGPAIGGLVIARVGLAQAYGIDVVTFGAAIAAVLLLSPQVPLGRRPESPLGAIRAGLAWVRRTPVISASYATDLSAMVLSLPRALFPALALSVYHAGPSGLGLLYSAPGVGAVAGSMLSGFIAHLRHPGRAVTYAVVGWGVAITLFGLATASIWLAVFFLALAGAADALSAVGRNTIQQMLAPDRLRGRLSALYSMVVAGGPYLGDARAGAVASAVSAQFADVFGGLTCVAGCLLVRVAFPQLWQFDARQPGGEPAVEPIS